MTALRIRWLGTVPYREAWALQRALHAGPLHRNPLRMSMLTSLDFTNNRRLGPMTRRLASVINDGLRGNLRFQSLSVPFELWSDGCNTPVFEEMQASACLMNADSAAQRQLLYRDSDWRRQLRREWLSRFGASFHKDLARMQIVGCPDAALVGQSFADVALRRGDGLEARGRRRVGRGLAAAAQHQQREGQGGGAADHSWQSIHATNALRLR